MGSLFLKTLDYYEFKIDTPFFFKRHFYLLIFTHIHSGVQQKDEKLSTEKPMVFIFLNLFFLFHNTYVLLDEISQ